MDFFWIWLRGEIGIVISFVTMAIVVFLGGFRILPIQARELKGANGLRRVKVHMIVMVHGILLLSAITTGLHLAFLLDWSITDHDELLWVSTIVSNGLNVMIAVLLYYVYVKDRYNKSGDSHEMVS